MSRNRFSLALILALAACIGTAHASAKQHLTLPRKSSDARVAVAIYEFTSNLPEISPRGATEQFKTALVLANLGLLCLAHHALRRSPPTPPSPAP